jgi:hypothetical protein
MMWTLGKDSEFGSSASCITGDVGMQILIAGVTVAAKSNNKPVKTQQ